MGNKIRSRRGRQWSDTSVTPKRQSAGCESAFRGIGERRRLSVAVRDYTSARPLAIVRGRRIRHARMCRGVRDGHERPPMAGDRSDDWFNHRRLLEPIGNLPARRSRNVTMP